MVVKKVLVMTMVMVGIFVKLIYNININIRKVKFHNPSAAQKIYFNTYSLFTALSQWGTLIIINALFISKIIAKTYSTWVNLEIYRISTFSNTLHIS